MNWHLKRLAVLCFGLLMICVGFGRATTRAAEVGDFVGGNVKYAAGDFAGAAKDYEAQVGRGEYSANLFYNLGDAYARAGDKGRAILNYRRALFLEPVHTEAAGNLAFVGGGKLNVERWGGVQSVWNLVAVATAVCGWLGAAGWLILWASPRFRMLGTVLTVGGGLLCAAGLGAIWFLGDEGNRTRAVVVAEAAPALYSPVEGAKVVTTLPLGGEVRLLSAQGAWSYVLLADGSTPAWLASKNLEPLVPR